MRARGPFDVGDLTVGPTGALGNVSEGRPMRPQFQGSLGPSNAGGRLSCGT
jgi:hypothetical protein